MKARSFFAALFVLLLCLTCGLSACKDTTADTGVTFIVDGEVYATVSSSGQETITLPSDPTKDGYAFSGWFYDDGVWNQPFDAGYYSDKDITDVIKVYAKWLTEADNRDVSVTDAGGASISGTKLDLKIAFTTSVFNFYDNIKVSDGATFKVYSDIACTAEVSTGDTALAVGNNVFYVKVSNESGSVSKVYTFTIYRGATYNVTFELGSGISTKGISLPDNASFAEDTKISALPLPTIDSGNFLGWYYDNALTKKAADDDVITKDITLYANVNRVGEDLNAIKTSTYLSYSDAETDFSFTVAADDESDVRKSLVVYNLSDSNESVGYVITKVADKTFKIEAADGFTAGSTYKAELQDGCKYIVDDVIQSEETVTLNFIIKKEEVQNLKLSDGIF